jgi:hypothetical protein
LDYIGLDGAGTVLAPAPMLFGKQGGGHMGFMLHASLLALGCATFFGIIFCSRCPDCGWHEWVGERLGRDRPE